MKNKELEIIDNCVLVSDKLSNLPIKQIFTKDTKTYVKTTVFNSRQEKKANCTNLTDGKQEWLAPDTFVFPRAASLKLDG